MQTWYVLPAMADPKAAPPARAATLDAEAVVGDPTGGRVTTFPSVVVTSPNAASVVFPDNAQQATLAEVQAAQAAAETAEADAAEAVTVAKTTLATLLAQQSAFAAQIQADVAMFQATTAGSTIQQEHIDAFVRIVNGFSTVMESILAHLTLNGYNPP